MSDFTAFVNAYGIAFTDDVSDPYDSKEWTEFDQQIRYNVKAKKIEEVTLDNTATRTLNFTGVVASDWRFLLIRVIGTGTVNTTGTDQAAAGISGITGVYGTAVLPGIVMLSTYNLTAITLASLADGTVFEVFAAVCEEDA